MENAPSKHSICQVIEQIWVKFGTGVTCKYPLRNLCVIS